MAKYIVDGGIPLKGKVGVLGAKNSGFKLLIAALLSDESSTITNIANNSNVVWVAQAIKGLGGEIVVEDAHTRIVSGQKISKQILENENSVSRASSMFIPVLLHRFGRAKVPNPSGDKIGQRPIDMHIKGLEAMGAKVVENNGFIEAKVEGKLKGTKYRFDKNSHTGTETIILAACLAEGRTIIDNAAEEPEVDDMIGLLNKMGGKIRRTGQRVIGIDGVSNLRGVEHKVMPDRGEVVTFACAALATRGDVTILFEGNLDMRAFTEKVLEAGGSFEEKEDGIRFLSKNTLKATSVQTAPHPGFLTDWQPLWTTLMTQAYGLSIVHETVHENRFGFVESLKKMGAEIEFFKPKVDGPKQFYNFHWTQKAKISPHAIKIQGPTKLQGSSLEVNDIRAGATLVLAALTAEGTTVLENIEHIERGYENLEERLELLGARIKRVG